MCGIGSLERVGNASVIWQCSSHFQLRVLSHTLHLSHNMSHNVTHIINYSLELIGTHSISCTASALKGFLVAHAHGMCLLRLWEGREQNETHVQWCRCQKCFPGQICHLSPPSWDLGFVGPKCLAISASSGAI